MYITPNDTYGKKDPEPIQRTVDLAKKWGLIRLLCGLMMKEREK